MFKGVTFHAVLGEGSNGVVLRVSYPSLGRDVALKILSHFWSTESKALLECERLSLERLPPHPSIIRLLAPVCVESIPDVLIPHLNSDMREAVRTRPDFTTTFFPLEAHPSSLNNWRTAWPSLPFPYHLMWRLARDLLAGVVHLSRHGVVHLDLKLDNVLVSIGGSFVISDFGISAIFPMGGGGLKLQYKEPLGILVNRSVLPPELLNDLDRAKTLWASLGGKTGSTGNPDLELQCGGVGAWGVGSILWEVAFGSPPFPEYPGVREDVGDLPPMQPPLRLPNLPPPTIYQSVSSSHQTGDSQSPQPAGSPRVLRVKKRAHTPPSPPPAGYPAAFVGILLSLLEPNPLRRMDAEAALALLEELEPHYVPLSPPPTPLSTTHASGGFCLSHKSGDILKSLSELSPQNPVGPLPGQLMERGNKDSSCLSSNATPPRDRAPSILLRAWTGHCRLLPSLSPISSSTGTDIAAAATTTTTAVNTGWEGFTLEDLCQSWPLGLRLKAFAAGRYQHYHPPKRSDAAAITVDDSEIRDDNFSYDNFWESTEDESCMERSPSCGDNQVELLPLTSISGRDGNSRGRVRRGARVGMSKWSALESEPVYVKNCRGFLGGYEISPGVPLGEILATYYLTSRGSGTGKDGHETDVLIVIDLAPSTQETPVLSALRYIQAVNYQQCQWKDGRYLDGINMDEKEDPNDLDSTVASQTLSNIPISHLHRYSVGLTAYSNAVLTVQPPPSSSTQPTTLPPLKPPLAFPFVPSARVALSILRRSALLPPSSTLSPSASPASLHSAVSAAAGLLRNVTCCEDVEVAQEMCRINVLDGVCEAYWADWSCGALPLDSTANATPSLPQQHQRRHHGSGERAGEDLILAASNLLRFKGLHSSSHVPVPSLAAMASDSILRICQSVSISNPCVDLGVVCKMLNQSVRLLRYLLSLSMDGGGREEEELDCRHKGHHLVLLQNSSTAPRLSEFPLLPLQTRLAWRVASGGPVMGALATLLHYASIWSESRVEDDNNHSVRNNEVELSALCESSLGVLCTLLLQTPCRSVEVCPFAACGRALNRYLRSSLLTTESAHSLAAACLRNLACVPSLPSSSWLQSGPDSLLASLPGGEWTRDAWALSNQPILLTSPALTISASGAPSAMEEALTRHVVVSRSHKNGSSTGNRKNAEAASQKNDSSWDPSIVENHHIALFNLHILILRDVEKIVEEASREAHSLRLLLDQALAERDVAISSASEAGVTALHTTLSPLPTPQRAGPTHANSELSQSYASASASHETSSYIDSGMVALHLLNSTLESNESTSLPALSTHATTAPVSVLPPHTTPKVPNYWARAWGASVLQEGPRESEREGDGYHLSEAGLIPSSGKGSLEERKEGEWRDFQALSVNDVHALGGPQGEGTGIRRSSPVVSRIRSFFVRCVMYVRSYTCCLF